MTNPITTDADLIAYIRARCAAAFKLPLETAFFEGDYHENEDPDVALLRLYNAEREATIRDRAELGLPDAGMDDAIDALIFG
jgi:hypothetical protein